MTPAAAEVINWIYRIVALAAGGAVVYFVKNLLDELRQMRRAIEEMSIAFGKLDASHEGVSKRVDRLERLWDDHARETGT